MTPTSHHDAWAAGVIDSDGCITIKRRPARLADGTKRIYYSLFVVVGQAGHEMPPMIRRLKELYGGSIDAPRVRPGRLPVRHWCVAHRPAEALLKRVLPYLVQKRDQAEVALEFRRTALGRGRSDLQEAFALKLASFKHYTRRAHQVVHD